MKIISRKEAKTLGLLYYFTGNPCKNNHVDKRITVNGTCYLCQLSKNAKYNEKNWQKLKIYKAGYFQKNKKKLTTLNKEWRENNPEQTKLLNKLYYQANKTKMANRAKQWRKDNRGWHNYKNSLRRKTVKRATPKWANHNLIKEIYISCPEGHAVDHIIPLQGKLVCGLHVENNLQYLTKVENSRKRNTFIVG